MKLNLGNDKKAIQEANNTSTLTQRKSAKVAPTGLYKSVVLGDVFLRTNPNTGSISITFRMEDKETGQAIEATELIQTSRDKGGSVLIKTKTGKPFFTNGYRLLNTISQLTIGSEAYELETEKKLIEDVFDFESLKEKALKLEAFTELKGVKIQAAVVHSIEDQLTNPEYYTEFNTIELVGNEDGLTLNEIKGMVEEPTELTDWLKLKGENFINDKRKQSKKDNKSSSKAVETLDDDF